MSFTIIIQSFLYKELISDICKIIENNKEQLEFNTDKTLEQKNEVQIEEQKEENKGKETEEQQIEYIKAENEVSTEVIGKLNIPDIDLKDKEVYEGTDLEVLEIGIGHFTNTSIFEGNVGLASHNSGTSGDEFKNLKDIKNGSKIYYQTEYGNKVYSVETIVEISDEDWSYLEETKDNRITLLTCVSGKPNNRLCVQGIEIKD